MTKTKKLTLLMLEERLLKAFARFGVSLGDIRASINEGNYNGWSEGAAFIISMENGLPGPYDDEGYSIDEAYATCLDGTGYFIEFVNGGVAAVHEA